MQTKNVVLGGVVGTVFIFLYDWVVHGMMLMSKYEATADLWRSASEMESLFVYMVASQAALAFAMAYFVNKKNIRGFEKGACFGAMIGVFLGIMAASQYVHLPLDSMMLPVVWAVSILVSMTVVGGIVGYFNK